MHSRSDSKNQHTPSDAGAEASADAAVDAGFVPRLPGTAMSFGVSPGVDTFINLATRSVVEPGERQSLDWDLVFSGYFVQSNSGPSGPGAGAAFGPTQDLDLLFDAPPEVPFRPDSAAGALSSWFAFGDEQVYSRGHVYGIDDGERLWKLQFVSYYQEQAGEPTPAVYSLRYQELRADGEGELVELDAIDARGSGANVVPSSKLACVNLSSKVVTQMDEADARADSSWHLCLRRTQVFVNGGYSGPGSVTAVDLDAGVRESTTGLARVTSSQLLEHFAAVDYAALTDAELRYRADDAVRSGIGAGWVLEPGPDAVPLPRAAWLVRGADGVHYYGVLFTGLQQPEADAPGHVSLQVKAFASP